MSTPLPRHILVPHDFSDTAQNALSFALDLASQLGARVTLVHAYEVPTYAYPDGVAVTTDLIGNIEQAATTALAGVAARAERPGVEIRTVLRQGTPWSEINATAKDVHADLIVMGTHGRQGLAHALLGSVAEKIVRTAPCPVLTVHAPARSS
jgi:nucleotide-binding universal stress UspA family protein